MHELLVHEAHESDLMGHFGVFKTLDVCLSQKGIEILFLYLYISFLR